MLPGTSGDSRTLRLRGRGIVRSVADWLAATFGRCLTTRAKHHMSVTMAVGGATAAHYMLEAFAPAYLHFSPLAGFIASLYWIWRD